jgi:hypothetical protein
VEMCERVCDSEAEIREKKSDTLKIARAPSPCVFYKDCPMRKSVAQGQSTLFPHLHVITNLERQYDSQT